MAISQSITVVTADPDRNTQTQEEFDAEATAFADAIQTLSSELNTWATQANSTASTVNTDAGTATTQAAAAAASASAAATSANNAATSANHRGAWSGLTGALTVPASVTHDSKLWLLLEDVADVTASEPGVSADWQDITALTPANNLSDLANAATARTNLGLPTASEAEMQAGTETALRAMSPALVGAAIGALVDQYPFTATGAISAGEPVVLLADGTVQAYSNSAQAPTVFESAAVGGCAVARLSDTSALVVYADEGNSSYGTAVALALGPDGWDAGTPLVFDANACTSLSVCALGDDTAVVAYTRSGGLAGVVLSISGTTVTKPGSVTAIDSSGTGHAAICALDSGRVLAACARSTTGYATAATVSGSTITPGTPLQFEAGVTAHVALARLSVGFAIVAYCDDGDSDKGRAAVLSVSSGGTTVYEEAQALFNDAVTTDIAVGALDSTRAVITYRDGGNSNQGTAQVVEYAPEVPGSGSGPALLVSAAAVFETGATTDTAVAALSPTQAVVAYVDGGNSSYGTACVLDIDGALIQAQTPVVFESAATSEVAAVHLADGVSLVVYSDDGNSSYGTALALDGASARVDAPLVGLAVSTVADEEALYANLPGSVSTVQSGLTAGQTYWVDASGALSASDTGREKIGVALSATELLITGEAW